MTTMTTKAEKGGNQAGDVSDAPAPAKKKGKRKKLIIGVVLIAVLGAGAKYEMGTGSTAKKSGPHAAIAAKPGPLVPLDAVTVNLAGGHYLRVGVTVQFTDKVSATSPPDGAPALDQTISYFTGMSPTPLETSAGLTSAKAGLKSKIADAYPKDPLYDVLFTSFVVQ
jgi:flagellar FliL protein